MKLKKIMAIALVVITGVISVFTLVGCNKRSIPGADAIIMIDVGAKVELVLDNKSKVITINALNEDGEVMMIDTKYEGLSYKVAVENFVKLAINMGYINKLTNVVYIDSICSTDKAKVIVNREIFNIVKTINRDIDVKSYSYKLEILNHKAFITNIAGLENFSFLQFRMISSIMRFEDRIMISELIRLDIKELTIELVNLYRDNASYGSAAMADVIRIDIKSARKTISDSIIALQSAEFRGAYSSYEKAYAELFSIMAARDVKQFSEIEIDTILATVGIINSNELAQAKKSIATTVDGKSVYLTSNINNYIEQSYLAKIFKTDADRSAHENKINDARKLYDPLYTKFTPAEAKKLSDALVGQPEQLAFSKLTHVFQAYAAMVALQDRLSSDYAKAKTNLSDTVTKEINVLEKKYKDVEQEIKLANKNIIEAEIERVRELKKKRLEIYD